MRADTLPRSVPMPWAHRLVLPARSSGLLRLAAAGLALEAMLLFGFLLPLSMRRNPAVVADPSQLAAVLGDGPGGAFRFVLPVLVAFTLFGAALLLARRLCGHKALWLVLGGTVLFSATLLPINPLGAHDVYHNIADARTLWLHGDNPTIVPPLAHSEDPFFAYVPSWQSTPSAYGPVWYTLAGGPLLFTGDQLWPAVIAQKLITVVFLLGTAALVMLLAERIRPGTGVLAGVLVGWNPLLQWESAGNAHNDVVMVFFALAAIYALSRRWWPLVFPLLALSIASKETLAVLGPVLLVWMLKQRSIPRRQVARSLALGGLVLATVYAPLFAGKATLGGLQRESAHVTSSPGALIYTLLHGSVQPDAAGLLVAMKLVAWPIFLAGFALVLWRMPRNAGLDWLGRAAFCSVFLLLTLVIWWFMPWYLFWLVPLAALLPDHRAGLVTAVFSCTAMLQYVPHFWLLRDNDLVVQGATAVIAFLPPVLVAVAPRIRRLEPVPVVQGDSSV